MRRSKLLIPGLALVLAFSLAACGMGKRQSPVASDEEVGRTHASGADEDKPTTYTTTAGDTLSDIAARPEIYGEPGLWPLIQDANGDSVGDKMPSTRLKSGMVLDIPRGLSSNAFDEAREKARQASAAAKARLAPKHAEAPRAHAVVAAKSPKAPVAAKAPMRAHAKAVKAVAKPIPTPLAVEAAKVPKAKAGGMMPLFFLLLLILAALGAVLYVFSKRDKQDGD